MSGRDVFDQYLLYACSPRADEVSRIPEHAWPEVMERARRHKVPNLVLDRLLRNLSAPGEVFVSGRRGAAVRSLFFSAWLLDAMAVFGEHQIEALCFKGLLLSDTVFGGPDIRTFADIDILVPKHEMERAARLLMGRGFRLPNGVALSDYFAATIQGGHHLVLQHDARGVVIELHWEMSGRYLPVNLDFPTVQPFLERVSFEGREMWNLGPEIGPLYLCVHGAREYWRILDHVVCVVWHLARIPPDWGKLFDLAERWGAVNILLTGLGLSEALFDLGMPEWVADRLRRNRGVSRLVARQSRRIFEADRLAKLGRSNFGEFLRMHWTHLDDSSHFFRWVWLKSTTLPVADLDPASEVASAGTGGATTRAFRALTRYLKGP